MTLANFYPRPPRGGRLCAPCKIRFETLFLSTPSARRATSPSLFPILTAKHFYPRPPRGGRRSLMVTMPFLMRFLSTPSARRATEELIYKRLSEAISIHALREEGDQGQLPRDAPYLISIHALREEGDDDVASVGHILVRFLSTPSARRATCRAASSQSVAVDFYPRPPRGGRPQQEGDHQA